MRLDWVLHALVYGFALVGVAVTIAVVMALLEKREDDL